MCRWPAHWGGIAILLLGATAATAAAPGSQAGGKPVPPFSEVERTVWRHFQAALDFKPGDLITREDVEPLLAQLQQMWLPLADAEQILAKTPAKNEFLVEQLSTPNGRKFMRRIAAHPNTYDRLDRLSRFPRGQQTVRDLIRRPGGDRLVEYITTTAGGKEVGKLLAHAPAGERLNTPTGRIYTVAMLLERLKKSHTAALKSK